jgi:hypothetical protein
MNEIHEWRTLGKSQRAREGNVGNREVMGKNFQCFGGWIWTAMGNYRQPNCEGTQGCPEIVKDPSASLGMTEGCDAPFRPTFMKCQKPVCSFRVEEDEQQERDARGEEQVEAGFVKQKRLLRGGRFAVEGLHFFRVLEIKE